MQVLLERMDRLLSEYRTTSAERCAAEVACSDANWAVLRARLEGKEPDAVMIRNYYKTLAERYNADTKHALAVQRLDLLFLDAVQLLADREIPA